MSDALDPHAQQVALLYLAMAHGTDRYLSEPELSAITDRLRRRYPERTVANVQEVVAEALAVYRDRAAAGRPGALQRAIRALGDALPPPDRKALLRDLESIAGADGVVMENEQGLLQSIAATWEIEREPPPDDEVEAEAWDALHHLAFVYLTLAHGTDSDLSADEQRVIVRKLREWRPALDAQGARDVLDAAIARYAQGPDPDAFAASVETIKRRLPEGQRAAALQDLITIANADGVFLDDEEDLINELMDAWGLPANSTYDLRGKGQG